MFLVKQGFRRVKTISKFQIPGYPLYSFMIIDHKSKKFLQKDVSQIWLESNKKLSRNSKVVLTMGENEG